MTVNIFDPKKTRGTWKTPKALYAELDKEFQFDFDPCPPEPTFDGLKIDWGQRNFVNPPYNRIIKEWVKKCYDEYRKGKLVVLLIPTRTSTNWFHDYILPFAEIRFIRGRLRFDDCNSNAPFPSILVIWRPEQNG